MGPRKAHSARGSVTAKDGPEIVPSVLIMLCALLKCAAIFFINCLMNSVCLNLLNMMQYDLIPYAISSLE